MCVCLAQATAGVFGPEVEARGVFQFLTPQQPKYLLRTQKPHPLAFTDFC
jgi:hypothetical protein